MRRRYALVLGNCLELLRVYRGAPVSALVGLPVDVAAVLDGSRRYALVLGNCLELLQLLPDGCIDAITTDPPYSSGGAFRGDRAGTTSDKYVSNATILRRPDFAGDNRDQRGYAYWCALWMAEALRVTKPGGVICCFTDWRQLPTTTDAIQAGGWVWRGIVPWDKTEGCRPQMGRFAAQCEYVVWGTAGPRAEHQDVGVLPGYFRKFPKPSEKHHIAGKPVEVLREAVRIAPPGGVVLDLFGGGGSTGVACLLEGRRFIGCELVPEHFETIRARLHATDNETTPLAAAAGQRGLFERAEP